jgi:hypothetical protein
MDASERTHFPYGPLAHILAPDDEFEEKKMMMGSGRSTSREGSHWLHNALMMGLSAIITTAIFTSVVAAHT